MKKPILTIIMLAGLLMAPHLYTNWRTDQNIQHLADAAVNRMDISGAAGKNREGYVEVENWLWPFTSEMLQEYLEVHHNASNQLCVWNWGNVTEATVSALGIDRKHHFANSYLVGYQPFETRHIWVPLYTLILRKKYAYDHLQYSGFQEVWQNSKQAFYYTRGDCEDHAIILADWLISMGVDARVVLGKYKEEGHAWVVYFSEGNTYLLEATSKTKIRSTSAIPHAASNVHYHPIYQFNRDFFWVNTGSIFTTRYDGPQWRQNSSFVANKVIEGVGSN